LYMDCEKEVGECERMKYREARRRANCKKIDFVKRT
jgi:hypothetical protein